MEMITSHFGCGIFEDVAFNMGEGVLGKICDLGSSLCACCIKKALSTSPWCP